VVSKHPPYFTQSCRDGSLATLNRRSDLRKEKVMSIEWNKDVDVALANARSGKRPLLVDFNAAPM